MRTRFSRSARLYCSIHRRRLGRPSSPRGRPAADASSRRANSGKPKGVKLKKPKPDAPCRTSSALTIRLGVVATSVSIPLSSAAKLSGIMSRPGAMRRLLEMRSTTGMKMATTAVELMIEPRPPTAAISRTSSRFSLLPALASSQSPSRRATPVRTRPSPITKSAAMRMIVGSENPASTSFMVTMPVNGMATSTSSATASMRGRPSTNIAIAAASMSRTSARSRLIDTLPRRGRSAVGPALV